MHWGWYGGPGFGWISMVLFWGVVVFGIVWLVRSGTRKGEGQTRSCDGETALDILDKRYARGEITKEEYMEMKQTLKGG